MRSFLVNNYILLGLFTISLHANSQSMDINKKDTNKCDEIADAVLVSDKSFKPSKSFFSSELEITAEGEKDDILTCSIKGKSKTGYAIAYNKKNKIYLADRYSGSNKSSSLYRLSKKVTDAHSQCGSGVSYGTTIEVTDSYVICKTYVGQRPGKSISSGHGTREITLYDFDSAQTYVEKDMGNTSGQNGKIRRLIEQRQKFYKKEQHKKCMEDEACKSKYETRLAESRAIRTKENQYNINECQKFALDLASKSNVLSSPKIIHAGKSGPYLSCSVKYVKHSVAGSFPEVISITGNVTNGAYEYR